jgi:hypothetical protein
MSIETFKVSLFMIYSEHIQSLITKTVILSDDDSAMATFTSLRAMSSGSTYYFMTFWTSLIGT